jgi:hypothetical protein
MLAAFVHPTVLVVSNTRVSVSIAKFEERVLDLIMDQLVSYSKLGTYSTVLS